jgi:hypothetical protein
VHREKLVVVVLSFRCTYEYNCILSTFFFCFLLYSTIPALPASHLSTARLYKQLATICSTPTALFALLLLLLLLHLSAASSPVVVFVSLCYHIQVAALLSLLFYTNLLHFYYNDNHSSLFHLRLIIVV